MNGRRRLLLGTVLSIHNTTFTYPACQICFSRLAHSSNRYQCQKCGETYQDATQRYRLSVKVAEDQKLHMITVFGSCLEGIFGSSASSLHRQLQESERPLCDEGRGKAQQLLFQAAEDCLIGRSFIFAVKVPDHLPRDRSLSSSQLVACHIIPMNDDPTVTILNCYESILSKSSANTGHELSAHSAHNGFRGLADSEGSYSLHQNGNQFADYWQQSLGLTSSPTLNTLAESPSCSHRPSMAKEQSCEGRHKSEESNVLAQSIINPEDVKVIDKDHLYLPNNSPLRVKNSSPTIFKPHAETCGYNQRLSSRVSCRHHRHLQNVCNSNSYGCQDCSACRKRFPSQGTQTAESHQVEDGTWDDFPFSESLSEFIARVENLEEERFHFGVKENKFCVSDRKEEFCEGHSKTACELMKTSSTSLAMSKIKNETPTKSITPHCLGDIGSNAAQSKDPCDIIQSDDPGSEGASASSAYEGLQGLLQKNFLREDSFVGEASSSYPSLSSHYETFLPMNENATYMATDVKRNLQISNNSHHNKYILCVGQDSSSHPKETEDNKRRLEDEDLRKLRSDKLEPIYVSPGTYNASADLFDDTEERETLQSKYTRSLERRHGKKVRSFQTPSSWESPCTDVIVRRNSQLQASRVSEVYKTATIHGLLSCLQSTPIIRPLSMSSLHNGDGCIVSDPRAPIPSRRSSPSLTNFLLKNIRQSLSRGSSNVFSDHFCFYSPVSAERSSRQVLQRRKTLVIKSRKKKMILDDKENCNIRRCNGKSSEDGGDSSIVTRREMDQSEMDIAEDGVTASPLMSPLFTAQEPLPSDWSPELFNEMSNISKQSDTLQRRLF